MKTIAIIGGVMIAFASGYAAAPTPPPEHIYVETQVPVCAALPMKAQHKLKMSELRP